ncbi:hypothetical protein PbB2_01104 [Candidatus Phycosocius bacilliformis]|uniref:DUF6468 domain-containing protein n=1 Tax=Candidatus Phycosocius bacilliformis TaxID=1445552 RepID=A0A2P2E8P9_9PROT|nr:DUF6468 domain-containing protein [Candidatus Phycosocius bacilliformis]GBF57437.1 hypothetical protein PbB2_01104 [Candidatus Phycosocius bacilliformis]
MTDLFIPIAQVLLAVAMLIVAVLCLRLDRKITALREGKDGVAAAAAELSQAVARAEASVAALKLSTETTSDDLHKSLEEARAASEALKFLVTTARALEAKPAPAVAAPPAEPMRPRRDLRWDDEEDDADFRLARRSRPLNETWGGLR